MQVGEVARLWLLFGSRARRGGFVDRSEGIQIGKEQDEGKQSKGEAGQRNEDRGFQLTDVGAWIRVRRNRRAAWRGDLSPAATSGVWASRYSGAAPRARVGTDANPPS